jgi:hypothetical protein
MLSISPLVPIYLHSEPIDMRKSFDGLFGIIKNDLSRDVRDGGLFMFLNSRRNRIKILYWDTVGRRRILMRCVSIESKSGAIRPIRRSFKQRVVGLERSFAKANRSSNRCRAQKVDAAPDPVLGQDRPFGANALWRGVACYRNAGSLGHKPLKLLIGLTNAVNNRKPELQ